MNFWGIEGNCGSPTVNDIVTRYTTELRDEEPNNMFITNFVVVVVNCLISQNIGNNCNFRFLYSMMDTQLINHLNSCEYTYDELLKTTIEFKNKNIAFFKSPLCFLTICYFDRVQMMGQDKSERIAPLISCWNKLKLLKE